MDKSSVLKVKKEAKLLFPAAFISDCNDKLSK